MANSITPGGTSRSIFGVSSGDIVTGGSVTAATFIGAGKSITNINANNLTTGNLGVARGGTGNSSFITNALIFNSNNKLYSDNNLSWEDNILTINSRDFLSDTSNYVSSEASKLTDRINNTESILIQQISTDIVQTTLDVSNYILTTSNILIDYIRDEAANNIIYPATSTTLGSVKIGNGIYVNTNGVISLTPEIIYITPPVIYSSVPPILAVPRTDYMVCKFTYNPLLGTTFDRDNPSRLILPVWCKFTEDSNNILINNEVGAPNRGIRRIKNSGYQGYPENSLTSLELYGDIYISPRNLYMRNVEYMPLDTTYLELNCTSNIATYGNFESGFNINSMFQRYSNWALTIGFWLKVNLYSNEITIIEFSNGDILNLRKLNINYVDNTLTFYMDKIKTPIITIRDIYVSYWNHIIWSIEKLATTLEVVVYINGDRRAKTTVDNGYVFDLGFNKYIRNTISSAANTSNYNFCVSDFKIYNSALEDDAKKELYNLNKYTKYLVDFKDTSTICDIMAYGGGGGGRGGSANVFGNASSGIGGGIGNGNSNYGGGAGNLVYVNDAYISKGLKTITVGRGGSAYYSNVYSNIFSGNTSTSIGIGGSSSNINNYQYATRGNDTTFGELVASGGGAVMNKIFDYKQASNISLAYEYTFYKPSDPNTPIRAFFSSNYIVINTHTCNMASNIIGGCGSGNYGAASGASGASGFNITNDLRTFIGYTSNLYSFGNLGGDGGGGGIGTAGGLVNGGEGLAAINIENKNSDSERYFNFNSTVNFGSAFNLADASGGATSIGELANGEIYIACGGGGSNIVSGENSVSRAGYNSLHSGSGGNYGENGKHGALLLRFLSRIDRKVVPTFVAETSNYVLSSSNNIISYVNNLSSISGALLWTKATNNIYYSAGNVGIGIEPNNYKLEVAAGNGVLQSVIPEDTTITYGTYGIHTSNYSNIEVVSNITNTSICAKFNSSIWTTGNVISSSDERIKKDIKDLEDDAALQMILNLQPKTYNYIDMRGRGRRNASEGRGNASWRDIRDGGNATTPPVYGFIAQQIREVIPDAVRIQTEFIPNIFTVAEYNNNIITLPAAIASPHPPEVSPLPEASLNAYMIDVASKIKCYDMNDNTIIVEVVEVVDVSGSGGSGGNGSDSNGTLSFKIKDINYRDTKIFVYGTEVKDFHAVNKEYINTLNVCAVQELHRKIVSQQTEIKELNEKVNVLLSYIDLSRMTTIQDEINDLKARYDLIINYIDLSK